MQDRCLQLHPHLQLGRLLRQLSLLSQFHLPQNHSDPSYMYLVRVEMLSPQPPWNRAVQELTGDKTQDKTVTMVMQH